jgi:hypothetical protein
VLAGVKETFQADLADKAEEEMSAIETLLAGLFDYAGLYPPASLTLRSAADNYLEYRRSKHAAALGRFIINYDHLSDLRAVAGSSLGNFKLSVIASEDIDWRSFSLQIEDGLPVESIEIKCGRPAGIENTAGKVPKNLESYFEVPIAADCEPALRTIRALGSRAKIRMGGVFPETFPTASGTASMLKILADLKLPFKATAGLHHPMRSLHPLTYESQSPTSVMHGFVNLSCAAALLYFGGDVEDAQRVLGEENSTAWQVNGNAIRWRDRSWSTEQLATLRREFFISIGCCSFEEPIRDLELQGWL